MTKSFTKKINKLLLFIRSIDKDEIMGKTHIFKLVLKYANKKKTKFMNQGKVR